MSINCIIPLFQIQKCLKYIFPFVRCFSHTCFTANTWSMHTLPCLKPLCYSNISHSVPSLTLSISTLTYSLLTTLNKLIPLELLHSYLSLFLLYRSNIHAPRQSYRYCPRSKVIMYRNRNRNRTEVIFNEIHKCAQGKIPQQVSKKLLIKDN